MPAIEMADDYPIEKQTADYIERDKARIKQWPYSRALFLIHPGRKREALDAGEIFRQPDLAATLRKLVEAEHRHWPPTRPARRRSRPPMTGFYCGDIAQEVVNSTREQGGLFTMGGLAGRLVRTEEPVQVVNYRGIDVYKGSGVVAVAQYPRGDRPQGDGL